MEPSMHPPVMTGFLVILAVSGCASMKAPSPGAERDVAPAAVPPAAAAPPVAPPAPQAPPVASPGAAAQPVAPPTTAPPSEPEPANNGSEQSSAPADTAAGAPSSVNPAKRSSPAKTTSTPGTRPAKQTGAVAAQSRPLVAPTAPAAAAAAAPSPSSAPAPTPVPAAASSPTLNLADLEQRLRETRAIGVFTKLSLKNQVDDLLNAFRTLYRGPDKHPPAELRQRYDMLLMKVLSLLQDGDPPLASEIASSREAIWSILADPEKFATI
jgi:hypothetical protein